MPGNKEIRRPAAIKLLPGQKGEEFLVCQILTASLAIYRSEKEKEGRVTNQIQPLKFRPLSTGMADCCEDCFDDGCAYIQQAKEGWGSGIRGFACARDLLGAQGIGRFRGLQKSASVY